MPEQHLLTPVEAILAIDNLLNSLPGIQRKHVADALGISEGQLSRELTHLNECVKGTEEACAKYDSRSRFMRMLYVIDLSPPSVREELLRDSLRNAKSEKKGMTKEQKYRYCGEVKHLLEAGITLTHNRFNLKKRANQ